MATPEQWQKIKQIVGAALDREPPERSAFLDEACLLDRELRVEVESLLAAYAKAGAMSENPWVTMVADAYEESQSIGPYRLIHQLGVGGMGEVWRARHRFLVRSAAVKLIRPELLGEKSTGEMGAIFINAEPRAVGGQF